MKSKVIWMYWHQGFDQVPPIIQSCVQQWRDLHPDWEIHLLDQYNIYEYVQPLDIDANILNKMTLAHRSDLLRTQLLIKYGGVWADPTCFPLQKLEGWLPQYISAGFFFFYKPGRDRIISNWFISAEQGNDLLKKLYQALINYWNSNNFKNLGRQDTSYEKLINRILNRNLVLPRLWFTLIFTKILRIYPYMVYHFMLYHLMSKDNKIKQQFDQMPKLSAEPPHALQRAGMMSPLSDTIKTIIDDKQVPLFKLTWKIKQDKIPQDSNLAYLFNQINKNEHTDKA
ncbi:capsular polysaccharide synthesis protein [Psychroflexus aestuariivivens]|uniref:capsular polysaccharide synthesis protein n=1 Tax=Psychroflexus aestuariivivens TaxID=1795040 RepID=UPI000FDCB937|nr:capsular polysaccharide synthesis protein [Psychroflexus aestuariivivens]